MSNKNGKKHGNTITSLIRAIKYIASHYKAYMIIVIVCILMSAIAGSVATVFMQRLIDECITPGITSGLNAVWGKLISIIITMGAIYLAGVIASFTYTRLMAIITQGTLKNLRIDMFNKMETLPIKYFDTNAHGNIMSTYTNDTDALRQLIGQSMPTVIQSGISLISIFFVMLSYSLPLMAVVIIGVLCMLKVTGNIGGSSSRYMIRQQQSLAAEEGFVEEMIKGQKVIKVFNHEEEGKKDFQKYNEKLFEDSKQANIYSNILMPILGNMGNILYVIVAVIGGLMVYFSTFNISLNGFAPVTVGMIVSFLAMTRQMSQVIGQFSMQIGMIAMGAAGAGRIFELIDQVPEDNKGKVTLVRIKKDKNGNIEESATRTGMWAWKDDTREGQNKYRELKGEVILKNVDFGYNDKKQILYDISIYARPGEKIALVGSTGAGKTTITNLINRFYDIKKGEITYDGIDITRISKKDLRRSLGIVLQDVNLFTGTVMDNIRYGRLDATDEECIAAAKLSNADDFIRRLPNGYNTMLTGNGANLSQGQRQLISIARAEVANAPAMILDEATSSIDTRTEALVQDGMDKLMEGRTVFVIAHRLSTIRNSDAIMVMEHGRIIERGSHDELMKLKGTYYKLYTGALEIS